METYTRNLLTEELALLPTDEDVFFYQEHGWYISKQVIPETIIDRAIIGAQRFYRGERDAQLPYQEGYSEWKPEDGDKLRNNEFVSLQIKELRELALYPIIGAIAAKLANTNAIRLLDDQLVYKPPQTQDSNSTVGWHTDGAYWATCSSDSLLTAWVPFHDCDESRGCLVAIDGSHKWGGLENLRFFNYQNLADLTDQFRQEGKQVIEVPMKLKKGQISFHHRWTIHGSYPNKSNLSRLAMAVHLQDEANHYRPFYNQQGQEIHIFDEKLCRRLPNGDPDFSDSNVFPLLWSE